MSQGGGRVTSARKYREQSKQRLRKITAEPYLVNVGVRKDYPEGWGFKTFKKVGGVIYICFSSFKGHAPPYN